MCLLKASLYYIVFLTTCLVSPFCFGQADSLVSKAHTGDTVRQEAATVQEQLEEDIILGMEIDKLIVNSTITKAGNDFQELFYSQWSWPVNTNTAFIITITERPFRGTSTQILVKVNDLKVFEGFLQPRYDYLESISQQAVARAKRYIINYNDIMKSLQGEDQVGTGIY